jgi:hypothetical protein
MRQHRDGYGVDCMYCGTVHAAYASNQSEPFVEHEELSLSFVDAMCLTP